MNPLHTIRFIIQHPGNSGRRLEAVRRYVAWQLGGRLLSAPIIMDFVNGTRLIVTRGRAGTTGNLYTGLHEFEDMAFVLHALRGGDLFVDVGANIGAYTVLAASIDGVSCIAFEPSPDTFAHLNDNVRLNAFDQRVVTARQAIGATSGELRFTTGLDTVNHGIAPNEDGAGSTTVPVTTLDEALGGKVPTVMKIDVEGFESEVIRGAEATLASPTLLGIILEVNGSGGRYGHSDNELHEMLSARGFAPRTYRPLERSLVSLSAGHNAGNVIYIRPESDIEERLRYAPPFRIPGRLTV